MTLYLLTGVTDHEGEDPLLLVATLEQAKGAAIFPRRRQHDYDGFVIYEAELGAQPVPILERCWAVQWSSYHRPFPYPLTDWSPA